MKTLTHLILPIATAQEQSRVRVLLDNLVDDLSVAGVVIWSAEAEHRSVRQYAINAFAYSLPNGGACVVHDLPATRTAIGRCIKLQHSVLVWRDEFALEDGRHAAFLQDMAFEWFCALPMTFGDATPGAFVVYGNGGPPDTQLVRRAEELAPAVSDLLQAIEDRANLAAVSRVSKILLEVERKARASTPAEIDAVLSDICVVLRETFNCFEVSAYIADSDENPHVIRLAATTFDEVAKTRTYDINTAQALTAWVARNRRALLINDLEVWSTDRVRLRRRYPELQWSRSTAQRTDLRAMLGIAAHQTKPPHAFIATPVLSGDRVVGVLRCSISRAQRFFSHRDLALLDLVATQVGTALQNWFSVRESEQENNSWRLLVESVSRLNSFVDQELSKDFPDENRIFREALEIAEPVLQCAPISDVRMVDEKDPNSLIFAAVAGPGWDELYAPGVKRRDRRFALDGTSSVGAKVFATREVCQIEDPNSDPHYSPTFPNVTGLITVPIETESTVFGVFDLRKTTNRPFPPNSKAIAELLGRQLGLYHRLAIMIRRLKTSEREQRDTYEDLAHQMRTPTHQAHQRAQLAVQALASSAGSPLERNLRAIRGLCRKAHRVALCTGFFTALARSEPVTIRRDDVTLDDIMKMTIEAAADFEMVVEPAWGLTCKVDRPSFDIVSQIDLTFDKAFVEQVLNCLLDNAAKYSLQNSMVLISGGLTSRDREAFYISVRNRGRRIRQSEVELCKTRHWRGEAARDSAAEGNGIGLWLSDQIMRAHDGRLVITATDERYYTDVRMIFPLRPTPHRGRT